MAQLPGPEEHAQPLTARSGAKFDVIAPVAPGCSNEPDPGSTRGRAMGLYYGGVVAGYLQKSRSERCCRDVREKEFR